MKKTLARFATGLSLALAGGGVFACSCVGPDRYEAGDQWAADAFAAADYIVHAEVVELISPHRAKLRVIEDFKGSATTLTLNASPLQSSMCGTRFSLGERNVYMVRRGELNLCGRLDPTESMLQAMRRLKQSAGPKK